jgi:Tfp pilus assembly major pilin PilA
MNNQDKINWKHFSSNTHPKAIQLLEKNLDKINWKKLSSNPSAIHLIENNLDKINWSQLCFNSSAIDLLEKNQDKIDWIYLSSNPSIFTLDYEQMKLNIQDLEEDLLKAVLHPRRVFRNIELYEYDLDDMFD